MRRFTRLGYVFGLSTLVGSAISACRTTDPASDLRHLENDFVYDGPAFMWHRVPDRILGRFIKSHTDSRTAALPQDSMITQRMQKIVDKIDSVARGQNPEQMSKIPSPIAVVLHADRVNAFVTSRSVCVEQWVTRENAPDLDPRALPPPTSGRKVLDMTYPGEMYETTLATGTPDPDESDNSSHCEVMTPDSIGWDRDQFVAMYNAKLRPEKQQCRLAVDNDKVVVPSNSDCGILNSDYIGVLRFDAQANVVFFYTGLLKEMTESSVATVAAHELAHIYKAHSPALTAFDAYFFIQNHENELSRPQETTEHEEVRKSMMDASYLDTAPRTQGARFDSNLFWVTSDLRSGFLSNYCRDGRPCATSLASLNEHAGFGGGFDEVWENIGVKPLEGNLRDLYLRYEELVVQTLEAIPLESLSDSDKEQVNEAIPDYMKKYFSALDEQESLVNWLEVADAAIVAEIPRLRDPFERGASLGLGFYSSEEEADEVGLELAARSGISGKQAANLWIEFMESQTAGGFQPGIREASYEQCHLMRDNGWENANSHLLIDSLANIHHGKCYRLFNTEREWKAHNMSRFAPSSNGIVFNEQSWNQALLQSISGETVGDVNEEHPGERESAHRTGFHGNRRAPACVFAPPKPKTF